MMKQEKIGAPRGLRRYRIGSIDPCIVGHVFPKSIVLSIRTPTRHSTEDRLLDAIELPRNVKPAALGKALMDAFSRQIDITRGVANSPPDLSRRAYYKDIEPSSTSDGGYVLCRAERSQVSFSVFVGNRGLIVQGIRPDTPVPLLVVFERVVDFTDTASALGHVALEAIAAAIDAPEPRFSWEAVAKICARAQDYLLIFFHKTLYGDDAGLMTLSRYELLDRSLGNDQLGDAVLAALLDAVNRPYAKRVAEQKALLKDRQANKVLDRQRSFPGVTVAFDGTSDPRHLSLRAQHAHDYRDGGTTRVPSDCDGATLGAAIRKLFKKMGVEHRPATPPPLAKLFGKYGYQALVVKGGKASVSKALEELRKLKIAKWAETPRSQGATVCAVRLSESACETLDELLASLRAVSKRHGVACTLAIANKTTDFFVFADLQGTKVRRLLMYGTREQHSWSKVAGQPQAWEARAFQGKRATEARVRDTKSDVLITDAMGCAALAVTAAYEQTSGR